MVKQVQFVIIQGLVVSRVGTKQQYGNNYDRGKVRKRVLSYLETLDCRSDRE